MTYAAPSARWDDAGERSPRVAPDEPVDPSVILSTYHLLREIDPSYRPSVEEVAAMAGVTPTQAYDALVRCLEQVDERPLERQAV